MSLCCRSLSALALLLTACVADAPPALPTGSMRLALTQAAEDGTLYHLRGVLSVHGAVDASWPTPEAEAVLGAELPPGDYTLTLEPDWQLERIGDAAPEAVPAMLLSDNPQPFSIASDTTTRVELRFMLEGGEVLEPASGALEVALVVETPDPAPCAPRLVLNEVDYDQEGADERELVEIFNAGACAAPTEGLTLVLHNGGSADGVPVAYASIELSAATDHIEAGAYLVVADAAVLAELDADTPALELPTALQNGDPDGVSLERDGQILDSMSYGGVLAGVTEGQGATVDPGAGSLSRCPDGSDSDDNAGDFALLADASPGAPNPCP